MPTNKKKGAKKEKSKKNELIGHSGHPLEVLRNMQGRTASFWRTYGEEFENWWSDLTDAERAKFIRENTMYLPMVSRT